MKQQPKKEGQSTDNAVTNLVRALKRDLQKKYGRVNYAKLRKSGYSDLLLSRLKQI